jgi:NAD(P)-dependent dehydrogenase (short-subunit alcohol dehydrogenase family)
VSAGFVPHLLENKAGKIISVSSRSSLSGGAKTGAYAAAKSALLRLSESMAEELEAENIQVNAVLPSTIDTPENRQTMPKSDFSKWVKPEKIAQSILFLTSSAADAISGISLPVYGRA